jgi:TonB-linked SusC/RagA family outer membrane protein
MKLTETLKRFFRHFKKKMSFGLILLFFMNIIYAQERTVQGVVTDESKVPIPGANIVIKGTTTGTVSDVAGKFSLKVPSSDATLIITFMGYETQEIQVGEQTFIDASLKEKTTELDKVVVIGYGVQKKSDLTGAVASVSSEELAKTPGSGVIQELQGKAAGVQIFNNSGMPGASIQVRVRGVNTITRRDDYSDVPGPIYVIDGVPGGDISTINPNDIEHIEVLKDASSQAIYGSSGGNGVVLITTKQGSKNQKAKIDFTMYRGIQSNDIRVKMCDTRDFINIYNSLDATSTHRITANPDTLPNTNWWNAISHNAVKEEYNLTITSGTSNSTSLFSLGYLNQDGIVDKTDYQRYNIRVNTTYDIGKHIKIGENVNLSATRNRGSYDNSSWGSAVAGALNQSPISYIRDTSSTLTPQQIHDRNIGWGGWAQPLFSTGSGNPVAGIYYTNNQNGSYRGAGNLFANVEILKGFTYNQIFGFNLNFDENDNFQPYYFINGTQENLNPQVSRSLNQNWSWNWQHVLDYKTTLLEDHNIDLTAGFESHGSLYKTLSGQADSLLHGGATPEYQMIDATLRKDGSALYKAGGSVSKGASYGFFGRVNYEFKNLFLFQFSYRYDGSSNFGADHRFGGFPAFSTGFKFTELEVVKDNLTFLNFGKVRFGWGKTGNDQIPSNKFLSLVSLNSQYGYPFGGTRSTGGVALAPGNPELQWEAITTYNYGIDLTFLNNKLSVTADYFDKDNTGMLQNVSLPLVVGRYGFGTNGVYTENSGGISNKGLELSVGYKNQVGDLKYSVNCNFTKIVSKLHNLIDTTTLPLQSSTPTSIVRNGDAPGAFWGYQTSGLYRASDTGSIYDPVTKKTKYGLVVNQPHQINSKGQTILMMPNAKPGDVRFVDRNGDGIISDKDKTVIGDPNPKFTYGLAINLEFKGFDMNCFFQGSYGNQIFNSIKQNWYNPSGGGNWIEGALNAYRAPVYNNGALVDPGNTNTNQFRLAGTDNYRISDWYVEDGSYLRLKSMQIGYTIPDNFTKKLGIERFRVYVGGMNLLTWTKYTGLDPEIGSGNPTQFGIDYGVYPQAKMYNVGINMSF